jgi:hypothetical protein
VEMPPVVHTEGISLRLSKERDESIPMLPDIGQVNARWRRQGTAARQCGIEIAVRPLAPVVGRKTRKAYRDHSARVKADPKR